jgi:hypothetical protein
MIPIAVPTTPHNGFARRKLICASNRRGELTSSPSILAINSPVDLANPVSMAFVCPPFGIVRMEILESISPNDRRISGVPSVDPSSMIINSNSLNV